MESGRAQWEPGEHRRYTELRLIEERDLRAVRGARYAVVLAGCRVWVDAGGSGFFGVTSPQDVDVHMTAAGETMAKAAVTLDTGRTCPEYLGRMYPVWEETAASAKSARDFGVTLPANAHPGCLPPGSGQFRRARQAGSR